MLAASLCAGVSHVSACPCATQFLDAKLRDRKDKSVECAVTFATAHQLQQACESLDLVRLLLIVLASPSV